MLLSGGLSISPPAKAQTTARVTSNVSRLAKELVEGGERERESSVRYPARVITNRARFGATLHKHAFSCSSARLHCQVGRKRRLKRTRICANPNSSRARVRIMRCVYRQGGKSIVNLNTRVFESRDCSLPKFANAICRYIGRNGNPLFRRH